MAQMCYVCVAPLAIYGLIVQVSLQKDQTAQTAMKCEERQPEKP